MKPMRYLLYAALLFCGGSVLFAELPTDHPQEKVLVLAVRDSATKEERIEHLERLKEYYESNIRRLSRTAWRLEFKDPGYSRLLDQRVERLKKKLAAVESQLGELQGHHEAHHDSSDSR